MSTVSDALSWWLAKKGEDRVDATVAAAHAAAAAAAGSSHSITAGTGAAENSGKFLYCSSYSSPTQTYMSLLDKLACFFL